MFPLPQPGLRNRRPRPINQNDNASTTGLIVNTPGVYVAPPPQSTVYGSQGQYGAMLPQVQQTQTSAAQNNQWWNPLPYIPVQQILSPFKALQDWANQNNQPGQLNPLQQYHTDQGQYVPGATTPGAPVDTNKNPSNKSTQSWYDKNLTYWQDQITADPSQLANAPSEIRGMMQNQLQQEGLLLPGQTLEDVLGATTDPSKNTDYAKTKTAQYYAAQGTRFEDQKRYDPERGKMVRIGDLIAQGKLGLDGKWYGTRNRKGRKPDRKKKSAPAPSQYTGNYGLVTFNTGS